MPAPALKWSTFEVLLPQSSPMRGLAVAADGPAAPPETVAIELPDLTDWPSPVDKARILLESGG